MRISDWSSDVCSSDLPSRPIPPKILSAAQDQLDFIEQEKLRELFAQRCLGGHPTGIDTPIFIIECEGDCHSKSGSFAIDEKWFPSLEESLRSEEHTSELQSLMRISYAVFCLKKKNIT